MLVIDDPESGNTLLDVSRVMSNKAFRDMKVSRCRNPVVVQFWREVAGKSRRRIIACQYGALHYQQV